MVSYFRYNSDDLYVHFSQDEQPHPYDFKMHTHEQCELYCFFGGKGSFRVEGTNYPLSPGDIIIMRPYEAHYIDIDPSLPYTRSAVQFDSNIFGSADSDGILKKAFFDRETGRLNRYSGAELGLPYKLFTEALTAPVGDHRTLILSRLMPLLHSISVVFDTRSDDDDSDSLEHRIVSFVGSRISDDISLDTICREFYISKPQLCRIFKAATGSGVGIHNGQASGAFEGAYAVWRCAYKSGCRVRIQGLLGVLPFVPQALRHFAVRKAAVTDCIAGGNTFLFGSMAAEDLQIPFVAHIIKGLSGEEFYLFTYTFIC